MPRILVAQPVGQGTAPAPQVVSQAAGPGDLFSFGHSTEVPPEDTASSELDPDLPAPQEAVTFRGLPKGPGKLRLYGVIAGAVVTMVLLVYLGKWMLQDSGKKVAYPGGSLRVMPLNPIQMKEGERKTVIVRVNRQGFQGPVKVEVKNPPDGVTVVPVTIPSDRDKGELYITASFTIGAMKVDLKVLARAQELEATEELPLTVVSLKSQAPFSREPLASAGAAP
jgi:predicted DNA-binding antitoxin AbrB/MazE fold protein